MYVDLAEHLSKNRGVATGNLAAISPKLNARKVGEASGFDSTTTEEALNLTAVEVRESQLFHLYMFMSCH